MFQITPDTFDRVEIGRIGAQELQIDATALCFNILAHEPGAVRLQPIPDDQQLLADRGLERLKEFDDLRRADRSGNEPKVKASEARPGNHRQLLPTEAILRNWGLAPGSPGTCATRSLGQTRLVDEDDYSALSRGDCLRHATSLSFQVRRARSSRFRA